MFNLPTQSRRLTLYLPGVMVICALLVSIGLQVNKQVNAQAVKPASLCGKDEKTIFTCQVKPSTKTVSLCSSASLTKTEGYLQYRFGLPGKVELEYPKDRTVSREAFAYSHYFRAKVDLTEISFSLDRYSYTVFDNYNGEEKPTISSQGVTVTSSDNQKEVTYTCRSRAKVDFGNLSEVLKNVSEP